MKAIHSRCPHIKFSFELELTLFSIFLDPTTVDPSQFELAQFLRVLEISHFFFGVVGMIIVL